MISKYFNLLLSKLDMLFRPEKVLSDPVSITVESTTRCNLECPFCARTLEEWEEETPIRDMTPETFRKILNRFPCLRNICLSGIGEPFLNPHLDKILSECKKRDLHVVLPTNGLIFEHLGNPGKLIRMIDFLSISIDSPYPEQYADIRKGGSLEKLKNNLNILKNLDTDTEKAVVTVLSQDNRDCPEDMLKLCSEFKIDTLTLVKVRDVRKPDNFLSKKEFKQIAAETKRQAKEKEIRVVKEGLERETGFFHRGICHFLWKGPYITIEGDVLPCCFLVAPDKFKFGNVFEDDMDNLWNGDKYRRLRKSVKERDYHHSCRRVNCWYVNEYEGQ